MEREGSSFISANSLQCVRRKMHILVYKNVNIDIQTFAKPVNCNNILLSLKEKIVDVRDSNIIKDV